MKTDDLIARLSAEPAAPALDQVRLSGLILLSIAVPVALFLGVKGVRPDLALAWANPVVPFKTFLPLVVCLLSASLALRLSRPEATLGRLPLAFILPGGIALALWIGTFLLRAPEARFAEVGPEELAECLGIIPLLSIVPTIASLRLLRRGASTSPGVSAMLAGLTSASGAAAGYSLFCTRDNPLFFVTWYGVAILIVTLIATRFGKKALSW